MHAGLNRAAESWDPNREIYVKSDGLVTRIDVDGPTKTAVVRTARTVPFEHPTASGQWTLALLREKLLNADRIETDDGVLVTHLSLLLEGDRAHLILQGARDRASPLTSDSRGASSIAGSTDSIRKSEDF